MSNTKHPRGLYLLFATEMWERFSYYGMRALFVLYLTKALLMNKEAASNLYGNYTGLVYLSPLIGGYLADRYLGNRKSIISGGVLMAMGQFSLFLSASNLNNFQFANILMLIGLGLLIIGNGFFKPNISTMVGELYEQNDKRKDSAYTIFYMGINLGAFFSPLVCGSFGETEDPSDFKWGFLAAFAGMVIGTLIFILFKDKYLISPEGKELGMPVSKPKTTAEKKPVSFTRPLMFLLLEAVLFASLFYIFDGDVFGASIFSLCITVPAFVITDASLTKSEKRKIWAIYILAFFTIFFWSAFEQAGASLTYFTDEQTDRVIFGKEIKTSFFQSLNAIFIVMMAPLFSSMWYFFERKEIHISSTKKLATGILLLTLGFYILSLGVKDLSPSEKVSMIWITGLYYILTLGELCLSPIGLSLVNKLSPIRFASLMMGVWYLSSATANKFSGTLSALYPEIDHKTGEVIKATEFLGYQINSLHDFFMIFVYFAGFAAILLFLTSNKLDKLMND